MSVRTAYQLIALALLAFWSTIGAILWKCLFSA